MMRRLLLGLLPALFCIFMSAGAKAAVSCSTTFPDSLSFGDVNILTQQGYAAGNINVSCTGIDSTQKVRACVAVSGGYINVQASVNRYLSLGTTGRLYYFLYMASQNPVGLNTGDNTALYVDLVQSRPTATITTQLYTASGQTGRSVGSYSETMQFQASYILMGVNDSPSDCGGSVMSSASATIVAGATITPYCSVTATAMKFSPSTVLTTALDETSALTVTCTRNAPYWIALDDGLNASAGKRRMKASSGGNYINYELYTSSGRTTRWGSTKDTDTVAGTGSASGQTVTVYGRIPKPSVTPPPGVYSDTVSATVNY